MHRGLPINFESTNPQGISWKVVGIIFVGRLGVPTRGPGPGRGGQGHGGHGAGGQDADARGRGAGGASGPGLATPLCPI